jgi:hypothetical protein
MLAYPIVRKGRGLQIARAGRRGGTFVQNLSYSAAQRWSDHLKTRPNRLIAPRQQDPRGDHDADIAFGRLGDHEDGIAYQPDQENPYELNEDDARAARANHQNTLKKWCRPKAAEREATAENWLEAEKRMVAFRISTERAVPCDRPTETINARFISLESYEVRRIRLCICGCRASIFIEEGFFPSVPIKPRTFFSLKLLRLLDEQAVRGGISKYAWAAGLRAVHESYIAKMLPDFCDLLLDAYHHFVAVENAVQACTSEYLQVRSYSDSSA